MSCGSIGCLSRGITDISTDDSNVLINEGFSKLHVTDWLAVYADYFNKEEIVEVRFKNTRKEYFKNDNELDLQKGDIVAVEAQFGHDIGTVSLTGKLVAHQLKNKAIDPTKYEFRKIFRKAKPTDIQKWKEALELEHPAMIRTRQITRELNLEMKIGDVEYQGDKSKAIFYYIAEDRIDFRELIKILAREFRIRIEMKQIGARQEAGRIGGIGSCGRELCCSTWKTGFNSVTLNASKVQELPASVQKLAGQCGKLKCCLMYELDTYIEAREDIPKTLLELETEKGLAYHHKTDILKRIMYYSYDQKSPENLIPVPVDRVKEIIGLNKKGIKVNLITETSLHNKSVNNELEFLNSGNALPANRFDKPVQTQPKKRKN
jgi:cell fate regulator YaaT (PSP1 superfamily)